MDASLSRALSVSATLHLLAAAAWSGGAADRAPVPLDVDAAAFSLEWTGEGESGVSEVPSGPAPADGEETPPDPPPAEIMTRETPDPEERAPEPETPDSVPVERTVEPAPEQAPSLPEAPRAAGASVTFPVPAAENPAPRYPERARVKGQEGRVTVRAFVAADGSVDRAEVVSSSGHDALDAAARRAVERWRFRPATLDGLPAPGEIDIPIQFQLKE